MPAPVSARWNVAVPFHESVPLPPPVSWPVNVPLIVLSVFSFCDQSPCATPAVEVAFSVGGECVATRTA